MATRKKTNADPTGDQLDILKKLLIVELYKLKVPKHDIAKKLKINNDAVSNFLKGAEKQE